MSLQSFSLFPQLPAEIRRAIWFHAMTPAIVYTKPWWTERVRSTRQQENPCLLRVCLESRTAALERYEKVPDIDKTFVNFSLDTVYLDINYKNSDAIGPSENEARIQFLAIDVAWFNTAESEKLARVGELMGKFGRCKSLRELTFVVGLNNEITEECTAKLSISLAKYENNVYSDLEEVDMGFYWLGFNELCDELSKIWVLGSRRFSIDENRWPEIYVRTRPRYKVQDNPKYLVDI